MDISALANAHQIGTRALHGVTLSDRQAQDMAYELASYCGLKGALEEQLSFLDQPAEFVRLLEVRHISGRA